VGHNPLLPTAVGLLLAAARLQAGGCGVDSYGDLQTNYILKLVGSAARQTVRVDLAAGTTLLSLDCNGDGDYSDPGELDAEDEGRVDGLDLQLGGADALTVNLAGSLLAGQSKSLKVLLGPGTNLLNVGSTAAFTLNADARFLIDIVGGPGTDK